MGNDRMPDSCAADRASENRECMFFQDDISLQLQEGERTPKGRRQGKVGEELPRSGEGRGLCLATEGRREISVLIVLDF